MQPAAVRPVRGSPRVGSEGYVAFIISQAVKAWPKIYANHPEPDRVRSKRSPIGTLAIVTDFIGSGTRVCTMLDKFWNVPSVRAWVSRGWVEFLVVTAAGTNDGIQSVRNHRVSPEVFVHYIAPTLSTASDGLTRADWEHLITQYGPPDKQPGEKAGFGHVGALVAFSYGIPNNTPPILHESGGGWRALYQGSAPEDLRAAMGWESPEKHISNAALAAGVSLAPDLSVPDAQTVLAFSAIRGKWRKGAEEALALVTGISVPDLILVHNRALQSGLLTADGRLTEAGQALRYSGTRSERRRPDIPTNPNPYYPKRLRVPRGLV